MWRMNTYEMFLNVETHWIKHFSDFNFQCHFFMNIMIYFLKLDIHLDIKLFYIFSLWENTLLCRALFQIIYVVWKDGPYKPVWKAHGVHFQFSFCVACCIQTKKRMFYMFSVWHYGEFGTRSFTLHCTLMIARWIPRCFQPTIAPFIAIQYISTTVFVTFVDKSM